MSTQSKEYRFQGKVMVQGELVLVTGLHIGGGKEGYEIGGLDNPVLKLPADVEVVPLEGDTYTCPQDSPYIPGTSLKGKMRSNLEWLGVDGDGSPHMEFEEKNGQHSARLRNCERRDNAADCPICTVFGHPAEEGTRFGPTRLLVWDAYPAKETLDQWQIVFGKSGPFTEVKFENTIDRLTSRANPRGMERVVPGSRFLLRFDYLLFNGQDLSHLEYLFRGLKSLEEGFLGGSGSRGYGRLLVHKLRMRLAPRDYYVRGDSRALKPVELPPAPSQVLQEWPRVEARLKEALSDGRV